MSVQHRLLDALRAGRTEIENHHIDELVAGRLDRRDFLRRGATLGMSATAMGAILAACGGANKTGVAASGSASQTTAGGASPSRGGTLNVATDTPATAINPLLVDDTGGMDMLCQTGEFLVFDNNVKLALEPQLATKWTHNADGSVWTFTLRKGVKFHNGKPLTADDVVYTFTQLSDPKNASNALSTFTGVLTPDGVRKVDAHTVAFHLEAPNGNFPYLISSDNYNAIVVPAGTEMAAWHKTFVGTGPFTLKSYTQEQGAQFAANPHYWGAAPRLDAVAFSFYETQQAQVVALQGGTVDVITQFVPTGAQGILDGSFDIIKLKASNHRELSMRCDQPPFTDPRVRQAVALTLNRPAMLKALLNNLGALGNDSPFAPKFTSSDTSVPQRSQDVAKAKQLMSAAGHPNGFKTTLRADIYQEIPQLAQVIKQSVSAIGIDIALDVESQSQYYGKATFGDSDWLDSVMSLVNYGDRGVPNVFLDAAYTTHGSWNAAHFHNPAYDKLFTQYVAAVDLPTQKRLAGQIERLLLDQTPVVIPYYIDGLTATTKSVQGVNPTSISQIFLGGASKAA
jgi:peptide/nickel transport system substrate-binding protein